MKGSIQEGHIPANKYQLLVLGLPPITPVKISGIEKELETVNLPDRTVASGGQTKPVEFTMEIPLHHAVEVKAIEAWHRDSTDPVKPGYKKAATLVLESVEAGRPPKSYTLMGLFPSKVKTPDLDMNNEGDMTTMMVTLKASDILPQ